MSTYKKYLDKARSTQYRENNNYSNQLNIDLKNLEGTPDDGFNIKREIKTIEQDLIKLNTRDEQFIQKAEPIIADINRVKNLIMKNKSLISKWDLYLGTLTEFEKFINVNKRNIEEKMKEQNKKI